VQARPVSFIPLGANNHPDKLGYFLGEDMMTGTKNIAVFAIALGLLGTQIQCGGKTGSSSSSSPNITTYAITVTQGTNGKITPGTTEVPSGASQKFTITPASGYAIESVTVDGTAKGAVTSYTFSNVTTPHAIAASFKVQATPGADIYAAGKDSPSGTLAQVWKNGVSYLTLPSNSGGVTSMAVSGSDVYVSTLLTTFTNNQPVYTYTVWKNGTATATIAPSGSEVDALAVSGTDVYAAGKDSPSGTLAQVWKNGVSYLTLPSNSGGVTSMAVSGSDVYVSTLLTTFTNNQPVYTYTVWKNGTATTSIAPSVSEVDALSVSVQ
jgi:hypothetical protein